MKKLRKLDISHLDAIAVVNKNFNYYFFDNSLKFLTNLTTLKLGTNHRLITSASISKLINLKVLDLRSNEKFRITSRLRIAFGDDFSVFASLKELEVLKIRKSLKASLNGYCTLQRLQELYPKLQIRCYFWKDEKSYYVGSFVDNSLDGKGVVHSPTSRYEGDFKNGKREGKGVKTFYPDLRRYEGDFFAGSFHGKGQMKTSTGVVMYDGEWISNHPSGKGTQWLSLSRKASRISFKGRFVDRYEGEFLNGPWHGRGTVYFDGGWRYEGFFELNRAVSGVLYDPENNIIID